MSKKFLTKIDATAGAIAPYYEVNVASPGAVDVGKIVWNPIDGTFDMGLLNGVTLQSGQELHFYGKASGTILNGQAVMFAGVEGDHLLMSQAYPSVINDNPQYFIGVATQDFNNNDFGYVTVLGKVRQLDTTAYSLGDVLYFDSESAFTGRLRDTMPTAPNAKIEVAAVVRVHATQGVLMVRPHVMPKLSQVQDVHAPLTDMSNSKVLGWNTNRWEARTVPAVLGYTPVTDARTITINGTTFDLSANRAWTITTDASARTILRYVATASQTTFTISGGYTPGLVDVYQNGAKLDNETDFVATNGTTIVLTNAAAVNDVIEVYRYQTAFLATSGQTTFLANYNTGMVDVFYNGSKLVSTEYTAGNGTSIVLGFACNLNDTVEIHAYSYQVGAFTGQAQLNGTGFVKANGTTITYDNSTYLTTSSAASTYLTTSAAGTTYLAKSGGTLTGALTLSADANKINSGYELRFYRTDNAIYTRLYDAGSSFIIDNRNGNGFSFQSAGSNQFIINSDGAMGFNYPILGSRSFMFRGIAGRVLVIEAAESTGIHSLYLRPNPSGRHLISSNYLSGGVYLPLSLSGRENDADLVLNTNGNILIGKTSDDGIAQLQVSSNATFGGGAPISFTNIGSGVYNRTVIYNNTSEGFQIDLARTTDSPSGTPIPFKITLRGGTQLLTLTGTGVLDLSGNNDVVSVNDKFSMGVFSTSYAWLQSFGGRSMYLNKAGNAVYAGTQRIDNNSDARLKDNIESVTNALATILSLKGRKFNMKDENGKLRYGFVAQEVKPYLSDFVTESDRFYEKENLKIENLLTLESSGSSWAALLVEAIKEQQVQIEELKARLNNN